MKYLALLLALSMPVLARSQVGIGTSSPNASAALELSATDKGFLPPRMTAAQRTAIGTPATGLMVYQTDGTSGFYVYSGSAWIAQSDWYSNTEVPASSFALVVPASITSSATANYGIGANALNALTVGDNNVALGYDAAKNVSTGANNTAVGYSALLATTGSGNTALGRSAGAGNVSGTNNTFLGQLSDASPNNLTNATAIGYGAQVSAPNTIQLGNADVTNVNTAGGITTGGSVGVGTTTPNASAILDIKSTSKGFLPPRLTQNQINSITAAVGLVAYNSTTNNLQLYKRGSESIDANNQSYNMTNPGSDDGFFQSFTVVNNGKLSSVDFRLRNPSSSGTSTVYCVLYSGSSYSGTPLAISDTITPTSSSSYNWEKLTFNNDNLINVTAGNVMTVKVIPIGNTSNYTWVGVASNVYASGSWGWPSTGFFSSYDAAFKSYITLTSWVDL